MATPVTLVPKATERVFKRINENPTAADFERCANCRKHVRNHYGGTEYRCDPRVDPDVPASCTLAIDANRECVLADGHTGPCATVPTKDLVLDEALQARFHHALDIINALVPLVPPTAFAWPPAQEALRNAQALLVEEGRVVASDEARAAAVEKWLGDERRRK